MRRTADVKPCYDNTPIQLRGRSPAPCINNSKNESLRGIRDVRSMDMKEQTMSQTKLHENPELECMSYNMIQLLELMDQKDSKVVLRESQPHIQGIIRDSFEPERIKRMFRKFEGCEVESSSQQTKVQPSELSSCSRLASVLCQCDNAAVVTPSQQHIPKDSGFRGSVDSIEQIVRNFKEMATANDLPRMPLVLLEKVRPVRAEMEILLKCTLKELQSKHFLSELSTRIITLKESVKENSRNHTKLQAIHSLEIAVALVMRFRTAHQKLFGELKQLTKQAQDVIPSNKLQEAAQRDYLDRCIRSLEKKVNGLVGKVKGCVYLRDAHFLHQFSSIAEQSIKVVQHRTSQLCKQPTPEDIAGSLEAVHKVLASSKTDDFATYLLRMYCRKHQIAAE